MKKIILYGIGSRLSFELEWFKQNYEIVAFSDKNSDKKNLLLHEKVSYISPENIEQISYDYIVITSVYAEEIKNELTTQYGICCKKILKDYEAFYQMVENNKVSFGELNADKTFFLIVCDSETAGLFSHYKFAITNIMYALDKNYIPVIDMQSKKNAYLKNEKVGKENSWEYYFEQPENIGLEEVYKSKNVVIVKDYIVLGYADCSISKINKLDTYAINKYNNIHQKYIRIQANVKKVIEQKYKQTFGNIVNYNKVCGVLFRSTDYAQIKPTGHTIQPSIEQMVDKIIELKRKWNFEYLYVATESQEAIDAFHNEFGDNMLYLQRERFQQTNKKWLSQIEFERENDQYIKGIDYLTEMQLLSKCNYLIAGVTCGTTGVLIMNTEFENIFLFNLGIYEEK